ncbi:hypothetical protein ACR76W_09090 [Enterococcus casseliflavus]|uniref:hypothetical protein n=1 Tax=Enterococcus casseliflavus TaxID=37734 RepID=UPI003DA3C97A
MNSRQLWGEQVRNKILTYVRENGPCTRKEIIENIGKEAASQIATLVNYGQLERVKKGVYKFVLQSVKIR